jgi:hypothetical protein
MLSIGRPNRPLHEIIPIQRMRTNQELYVVVSFSLTPVPPLARLGSAGRGTNRDARSGVGKCLGLKVAGEESANSE